MGSRERPIDVDALDDTQPAEKSAVDISVAQTPLQRLPGRAQLEAARRARQRAREDETPRKRIRTEFPQRSQAGRFSPICAEDRFWKGAFKVRTTNTRLHSTGIRHPSQEQSWSRQYSRLAVQTPQACAASCLHRLTSKLTGSNRCSRLFR